MVPPKQEPPGYILCHPGQACLTRDPVHWGGKVRLPQRPEVSSKQATPLPLPNGLRQPLNYPRISAWTAWPGIQSFVNRLRSEPAL